MSQDKELEIPGIYISEHKMNNMDMERIVVSNPATKRILDITRLPEKLQEKAVNDLVDRTLNWLELEPEEQTEKIKVVLTIETVFEYLKEKDIIRKNADVGELGIDEEGSVVITVYYTNLSREMRRAGMRNMSKKEHEKMRRAVNILGGNENLIDLAAKRLEKERKKKSE